MKFSLSRISLSAIFATAVTIPQAVVNAKYVFAHVVVGNTAAHTQATWATDISLAAAAGIDAFVLNIAYPDSNVATQVSNAFAAATAAGSTFKLFFAFDYLGGGEAWPSASVISYLNEYRSSSAYFNYDSAPFVSTFEGTGNIADWSPSGVIRSAVGDIYFVPDWTSLGPAGIESYLDNIQGGFSWDMWPNGAVNETDAVDKIWQAALRTGKTYMMGVSPWFFHSASGGTTWVWRGDDLWADRWAQTLDVQPDFVQIVTWNDYGESSYIGPLPDSSEIAAGSAPYVANMPHDSWRNFLPYYIASYKGSTFDISRDQMQYWYRLSPALAGSACGVVGNDAGNGQVETTPSAILEDGIFFSALLAAAATIEVQIGSNAVRVFEGAQGINHWSTPFNGETGTVNLAV